MGEVKHGSLFLDKWQEKEHLGRRRRDKFSDASGFPLSEEKHWEGGVLINQEKRWAQEPLNHIPYLGIYRDHYATGLIHHKATTQLRWQWLA